MEQLSEAAQKHIENMLYYTSERVDDRQRAVTCYDLDLADELRTSPQMCIRDRITVTEDDGTQHPGTTHDAEIMLAASELHTFDYWKKDGKSVKLHEKADVYKRQPNAALRFLLI